MRELAGALTHQSDQFLRIGPPRVFGLAQQAEIFRTFGGPVIDAADILRDPPAALGALCTMLGIAFDPAMLSWPAGPRPSDGVWAPYWYDSVRRSTGFVPVAPGAPPAVDASLEPLLETCLPYYEKLRKNKIKVDIS